MAKYCRSAAAIVKINEMVDADGTGLAALKKQLKIINEAEAANSEALGLFSELKCLCQSGAIELEALGCNDVSSLGKPLLEAKEKILQIKSNAEEMLESQGGKAAREKPSPRKSTEVKTDFEKPKSLWELMWGSGKGHSTQKEEAIPKEESRDKYFPDEDEAGDFE